MKRYILQQNALQGNEPVEIELPDNWDVSYHGIEGDNRKPLTKAEILDRLNRPYGMPTLRELAKGRKQVAVSFDDNSRGTPTRPMAEAVLEELHSAGIEKSQIRFICALGTHGAHNRRDFVAKLGEDIVRNYRIFNHNCYENCVKIGQTSRGVDVWINGEFMACDLKIGLGAITPHIYNSFGGGGKGIFPGLASIDTIELNHRTAINFLRDNQFDKAQMIGNMDMSGMRLEIEEMTRMVGELFKVDCIYNTKLELLDLYAGHPEQAYYAAIPTAQELYAIEKPADCDVVIVNANAKANEASIAISMASMCVKPSGGEVVLVDHTSAGQVTHYLLGAFGDNIRGRMCSPNPVRENVRRYILNMPYPEPGGMFWYGEQNKQVFADTWDDALKLLLERYGAGTKAAVIADGTISYFRK